MIELLAKIRDVKANKLRTKGLVPAVLYGPKRKPINLETDLKKFKEVFSKVGESSLISLEISSSTGSGQINKLPVLIHEIQHHPITDEIIHIDFYQPILTKEVEVSVPIIFEGESPAVKDLSGTLVKEIQEVKVKALPQNLPHEIKINIGILKTFEDEILVKDLNLPKEVKILRESDEIIALVVPPAKIEEELTKPIEEKVEEVEKVEAKKKEGDAAEVVEVKKETTETKKEKPEKK